MPEAYSKEQQTKAAKKAPGGTKAADKATKKAPGKAAAETAKGGSPKPSETSTNGGGKKGGAAAYVVRALPKGVEYPNGGYVTQDELSGRAVSKVFATKQEALDDCATRNGFSTSAAKSAKLANGGAETDAAKGQDPAAKKAGVSAPVKGKKASKGAKTAPKPAAAKKGASSAKTTAPKAAKTAAKTAAKRTPAAERQTDPRLAAGGGGTAAAKGLPVDVIGGPKVGQSGTIKRLVGLSGNKTPIWTVETSAGPINVMAHYLKVTGKAAPAAA